MGKYGFKITLTREAYENFKKAKELLGAKSWEDLSKRILGLIGESNTSASSKVSNEVAREKRHWSVKRGGKTRAIDILRDEKVMYEADIAGRIRDRDAFFGRLRKDGAVVVETAKQRIAVDPGFWDEFKKKLEKADTTNDEVLKEQLGEDGLKLLRVLREEGAVYFDGVEGKWKFIIEPEGE